MKKTRKQEISPEKLSKSGYYYLDRLIQNSYVYEDFGWRKVSFDVIDSDQWFTTIKVTIQSQKYGIYSFRYDSPTSMFISLNQAFRKFFLVEDGSVEIEMVKRVFHKNDLGNIILLKED